MSRKGNAKVSVLLETKTGGQWMKIYSGMELVSFYKRKKDSIIAFRINKTMKTVTYRKALSEFK